MSDDNAPDEETAEQYPHVKDWERAIVKEYGDHLNNTGGNDPLDLINDLNNPAYTNFMRVNVVRFVLACAVSSEVALIATLKKKGLLQ